jgi:hypothetical protein
MPSLRLDPDRETFDRIVKEAETYRRPVRWQAEILLRKAVGLPFPPSDTEQIGEAVPEQAQEPVA